MANRKRDLMGSGKHLNLIRKNIEINVARANNQWAESNKTETPEHIKKHHREMFENAERERERREK